MKPLYPIALFLGTVSIANALEVEVSGQVNRALMRADNGSLSETFHVDNDNSGTRVRLVGSQDISDTSSAGVNFELEYQDNASNNVNFAEKNINGEFNERKIEAYYAGSWGKVSIGQGDGAANGNIERDLSGTAVATFSNPSLLGGGIPFQQSGGPELLGNEEEGVTSIKKTISNLDFESRYDRLRYDIKLGAHGLAVSYGSKSNSDVVEVGARLRPGLPSGKMVIGLGYSSKDKGGSAGDEVTVGGSASLLLGSGLNFTVSLADRSDDNPGNPDSDFRAFRVGYKFGQHAVSYQYAVSNDLAVLDDESTSSAIGYVFKPIKWAELYAAYKVHSLDRTGVDFDDVDILTIGTRVKFKNKVVR